MKIKKSLFEWCLENGGLELLKMYELGENDKESNIIGCSTAIPIKLKCPTCQTAWITSLNKTTRKKSDFCPFCKHERPWKGYNLLTEFPEIASYWDYEENEEKPEYYMPGSHKKIKLKCKKGHSWENVIKDIRPTKTRNSLCPYCNHSRPSPEYNLESQCPEIASEWDYENNNGLGPREYLPYSQKKVYWKCSFNPMHHWQDRISNRTKLHRECKICNSQYKISYASRTMFYYLKKVFPDAECEVGDIKRYKFDILLPTQRIVIEHDGYFYHGNDESKKRELRKDRDLLNANYKVIRVKETIMKEENFFWKDNMLWYPFSEQKLTLNRMIEELVFRISGKQIRADHWNDYQNIKMLYFHERKMKSLAMVYPDLSKEWSTKNSERTDLALTGRNQKYFWTCPECNRDYLASIPNRALRKSGCPYCSNRKVTEMNNLSVSYPNLKKEWDYKKNGDLKPEQVLPGSDVYVYWKCGKGHSWRALIYQRTGKSKSGCPYCSHLKATIETCLATVKPYVLPYWDEIKNQVQPTEVLANSNAHFWWKCSKGHSWNLSANSITETKMKKFCPFCNNRKVNEDNNLVVRYPNIAREWDRNRNGEINLNYLLSNSTAKVWWICTKGHLYQARISNRCKKGEGCPICLRRLPSDEYNLKALYPQLIKEWDLIKNEEHNPEDYMPYSGKQVWWKCEKGHSWIECINKRTARQYGCPYCSGSRVTFENSLAALRPDIAKLWDRDNNIYTPEQVKMNSGRRVNWKCDQGHTWDGVIDNVVRRKIPCPICRKRAVKSTSRKK